ncbi:lysozyme inhibitor LprI family protein [Pseudomonas vranovensis]|uniref:Uncharacterized protein n=1 Tax=Pseudomonas vranovensis TaxID=321661 RepID=A0A423DUU9_9PSED|nr:hypothetical protein [Pseudomonas vranovensis]ROL75945.1 hypothetical protein BHU25_06995 [Pseudomonas vranovensis]
MKAAARLLPAALFAACLYSPATLAAGFDCSKASTLLETAICTTPSLSAKDDTLNERYKPLKDRKIFRELESFWLREVRNRCETAACLEVAYDQQIKLLTPVPALSQVDPKSLQPLPRDQRYTQVEDEPWQRFPLATVADMSEDSFAYLVDVATLDGVLNVVLFVAEKQDDEGSNPGNIYDSRPIGTLYEYSDARPGLHPFARNVRFDGWNSITANDQGRRYAGIIDGVFYYRQKMSGEAQQSMAYKLGSKATPQPSTQLYAAESNSKRFAKAQISGDLNHDNSGLLIYYPHLTGDSNPYDRVMDKDAGGWSLVNPTWSPTRPVLYFDNNGGFACIWRVDLVTKRLEKIVPEHEAVAARPVDVIGREAIVYLESDQLMFAIAPDQ